MEVKVRPFGRGERGQRRADRAGSEAGGETPGPHRHAPLEGLQRAQEPGPRTPDRVSQSIVCVCRVLNDCFSKGCKHFGRYLLDLAHTQEEGQGFSLGPQLIFAFGYRYRHKTV